MSGAPKSGLMLNSDLTPAAPQGGREPPADKARVVSTRSRVPTYWVSGRTLQPSIESVVASSFGPSDFIVELMLMGRSKSEKGSTVWGLCSPCCPRCKYGA